MIKTIRFEIETITPMFLAGADQRKAELRAASIKGLMRFWWRSLQAESDIHKLREKENKIFGSSDEKIGGSRFSIRITQADRRPEREFRNPGRQDPVGYMFYPVFMQKDRKRPYYPKGTRFHVVLSSRDIQCLKTTAASFWLLVYMGGMGTRSRRGAGNIAVLNIEDEHNLIRDMGLNFMVEGDNADDVARWLINNLEQVKRVINESRTGFITEYTNLNFSRFIISNTAYTAWKDALGAAGASYKQFRETNKHRIYETACFGFPVRHGNGTTVTGEIGREPVKRRGSPLIFKLIRAGNDIYWIVVRVSGEFLPEGGLIRADNKTRRPDFRIIDEYWSELKKMGKEHILSMPDTLRRIVEQIRKECEPRRIILFGSKARGDAHRNSDTDIAVHPLKRDIDLSLGGALDIVNLDTADASLMERIEKEGVTIL